MEYEGKLYGKIGKKHFELSQTTKDIDLLVEKVKALERKNEILFDACRTVVLGYEGDGKEGMKTRDHVFYGQCKKAINRVT